MKARSLIFDLFGDYLRYRGGGVRLRALAACSAASASRKRRRGSPLPGCGYEPRLADYRAGGLDNRATLVERMRLAYDYRHLPFRDPGLPAELLPGDWPGRRAHDAFLLAHGPLKGSAERAVNEALGGQVAHSAAAEYNVTS